MHSTVFRSKSSSPRSIHTRYDPTGQLTGADYDSAQADESYSYDANGNRTNSGYVTGPNNQLLSDGTYWYSYDAEGNRTAKYVWTDADNDGKVDLGERSQITEYKWDNRERLIEVRDYATDGGPATQVVDYVYDVENRWIARKADLDGDGPQPSETTSFVYDVTPIAPVISSPTGQDLRPGQIVYEFNDSGSLADRYLWGPAVDQVLADEQVADSRVVWPLTDQVGSVRDLAVRDGQTGTTTVANHCVFDSFGNLESQTNAAVDCLFGFTGRPLDNATGFQNSLNRWYDPSTGGWVSIDPIGFAAGDTNLGRYCGNRPIDAIDPAGLDRWFINCPPFGFHKAIVVDVWDEAGVNVVGQVQLDWDALQGFTVNPVNQLGKEVPGSRLRSNAAQDKALLAKWKSLQGWEMFTHAAEAIWRNCRTISNDYHRFGMPPLPAPPPPMPNPWGGISYPPEPRYPARPAY